MIASYTSATSNTTTGIYRCFVYPSCGTATITLSGRCPNCGDFHYYADTNLYIAPAPNPREVARQRKRDLSKRALTRARLALQRALDDPRPEIPLPDRKRPYARPRSKKRVCAGSSRYRVMVH